MTVVSNTSIWPRTSINRGCPPCPPALVAGGWTEIARTTLSCASSTIDVCCLPYHRQYQVLSYTPSTGNSTTRLRYQKCAGTQYSNRWSINDGAEGSDTNQGTNYITASSHTDEEFWSVNFIYNGSPDKLHSNHALENCGAGATNTPRRHEGAGKFDNLCTSITCIRTHCTAVGCFTAGAEVVVLGSCNPDRCMNFWELLTCTSTTCAVTSLTTSTFALKKYLYVQAYSAECSVMFNAIRVGNGTIDSCMNYSIMYSIDQSTVCCACACRWLIDSNCGTADESHVDMYILNISASEKLMTGNGNTIDVSGAATPPRRIEQGGKWTNTCNQINIIGMVRTVGCGTFDKGYIKVWGHN